MLTLHRFIRCIVIIFLIKLHITNGKYHYCTGKCSMKMNFNDEFQGPTECAERILSLVCSVQVTIQYNSRQIFVEFRENGTIPDDNIYTLYAVQKISYIFHSNHTSYKILFDCFSTDDCDWKYTNDIIKHFKNIDYITMFNKLRLLLYEYSEMPVSQCYLHDKIVDCANGTCSAIIFQNDLPSKRFCTHLRNPNIGIDITRFQTFPQSFIGAESNDLYRCHRNLCNSPTIQTSVEKIIHSYSSLLEIPKPKLLIQKDSAFRITPNFLILTVILLYFM